MIITDPNDEMSEYEIFTDDQGDTYEIDTLDATIRGGLFKFLLVADGVTSIGRDNLALEIYESHLPDDPTFADGNYEVEIKGCARRGHPYCSSSPMTVTFIINQCTISYIDDGANLVTAGNNVL